LRFSEKRLVAASVVVGGVWATIADSVPPIGKIIGIGVVGVFAAAGPVRAVIDEQRASRRDGRTGRTDRRRSGEEKRSSDGDR
jgi:hypothetical protein